MKAPEQIPSDMRDEYLMNGKVQYQEFYRNDCSEEVQKMFNDHFTEKTFNEYRERIRARQVHYYGYTDTFLYRLLEEYPIKDKVVCIFGSANPWYEAICVEYGAKKCIVVEYSDRESFHPLIEYKKPGDAIDDVIDVGLSISSFEHDGLGRYGDPLNPTGDLETMQDIKKVIKKDGLLFFAVPTGIDTLVWNCHRIYGKHRLPLMIENWEMISASGVDSLPPEFNGQGDWLMNSVNGTWGTPYQPVLLLKNIDEPIKYEFD